MAAAGSTPGPPNAFLERSGLFLAPAIVVEASGAMPVPPTTMRSAGMLSSEAGWPPSMITAMSRQATAPTTPIAVFAFTLLQSVGDHSRPSMATVRSSTGSRRKSLCSGIVDRVIHAPAEVNDLRETSGRSVAEVQERLGDDARAPVADHVEHLERRLADHEPRRVGERDDG